MAEVVSILSFSALVDLAVKAACAMVSTAGRGHWEVQLKSSKLQVHDGAILELVGQFQVEVSLVTSVRTKKGMVR